MASATAATPISRDEPKITLGENRFSQFGFGSAVPPLPTFNSFLPWKFEWLQNLCESVLGSYILLDGKRNPHSTPFDYKQSIEVELVARRILKTVAICIGASVLYTRSFKPILLVGLVTITAIFTSVLYLNAVYQPYRMYTEDLLGSKPEKVEKAKSIIAFAALFEAAIKANKDQLWPKTAEEFKKKEYIFAYGSYEKYKCLYIKAQTTTTRALFKVMVNSDNTITVNLYTKYKAEYFDHNMGPIQISDFRSQKFTPERDGNFLAETENHYLLHAKMEAIGAEKSNLSLMLKLLELIQKGKIEDDENHSWTLGDIQE
ncbi:MAG: hypothetical protein P0S95_05600 [Rhabdochlamydiaceae bacterium]|nr:hypothetical protein [Candidatus Amphrikana amoebophyrae]